MHTGVFLIGVYVVSQGLGIPRAYGGVSFTQQLLLNLEQYSPCIRGCFYLQAGKDVVLGVFPVHTGVFLAYVS